MHPRKETVGQQPSSQAAEGEGSLGAMQKDTTRPVEEKPLYVQQESQTEAHTHKKTSFMEEMGGEAKVLLGKPEIAESEWMEQPEGEHMKHPKGKAVPAEAQKVTQAASTQRKGQTQTVPAIEEQKEQSKA